MADVKIKMEKKIKPKKTEDKKISTSSKSPVIAVIRIKGEVKVKPNIKATLDNLRLRRKYTCVLINSSNKSIMGMVEKVKYSVAYGEIEKETLIKLIKERVKIIRIPNKKHDKKINPEEIAESIIEGKNLIEMGFKPFFRLHPPRGGIKSKLQYPKGVLGNNSKDINKLIERML